MAIDDRRRFALACVAAVVVILAIIVRGNSLRGGSPTRRISVPPPSAQTIAAGQLAEANARWRLLELRDSILTIAGRDTANRPGIFIDGAIPENVRRALGDRLRAQWSLLVPASAIPVAIAVVVDTSRAPHGQVIPFRFPGAIPIESFMPTTATNGVCVSLANLSAIPSGKMGGIVMQNLLSTETIAALLNPCALLSAFGAPGPEIARWLRDERWSVARFADWNGAPSPWRAVVRPRVDEQGAQPWLTKLEDPTWSVRGYVAPEGVACLAGEKGVCARVTLVHRSSNVDTVWRNAVVSSSGTSISSFYLPRRASNLGPADGWLVSEMVRTLGRDRFARFWRSSLPVDSAFKTASGQDLDTWVREWGRRMYGVADTGPSVSILGTITGIVIVVAGLGISVAVEARRRVA